MSLGRRLFFGSAAVDDGGDNCIDNDNPLGEASSSLIAGWNLDYDASDVTGDHHGTPSNVEFGDIGYVKYAASFNGSSSYIDISSVDLFDRDNFSVSLWIKAEDVTATDRILSQEDGGGSSIVIRGDDVIIDGRDEGATSALVLNMTTGNNTWHHVVLVNNNKHYYLYLDGSLEDNNNYGYRPSISTSGLTESNLTLGRRTNNTDAYFSGHIDQVRIFDKVLSSQEITTLYNEEACLFSCTTDTVGFPSSASSNLEAYYKLDGSADDESSNNNDGTDSNLTYKFGRFGSAGDFNGTASASRTKIDTGITGLHSNYSVSFWIKPDTSNSGQIVMASTDSLNTTAGFLVAFIDATTIRYSGSNGSSATRFNLDGSYDGVGIWTHICITHESSTKTQKIYRNGAFIVQNTDTTEFHTSGTGSLMLGGYIASNTNPYNGLMDNIRIYDKTLSADEVSELYGEVQCQITKDSTDPFGDSNEEAFYKMETASGTTVVDSTGSNDGVANNITFTSGSGLFGTYSADFNGSNSKITLDSTNIADVVTFDGAGSTDECTLSFWLQPQDTTSTNYNCFFSVGYGLELYHVNNKFIAYSNDTATFTNREINGFQTTGTYSINQWYHVVFTFTPTAQNWYVNGVIDASHTTTSYTPYAEPDATIGTFRNTSPASDNLATFEGLIDHVRIFDRVLGGDEIFQLYSELTLP